MRILILGGTVFLGRHLVTEALNKGHELKLFHQNRRHVHLSLAFLLKKEVDIL